MPGLCRTCRRDFARRSPVRPAAGPRAGAAGAATPPPLPPPRSQLVCEGCDQTGLFKMGGNQTSAVTRSHCRERAQPELLLLPPPPARLKVASPAGPCLPECVLRSPGYDGPITTRVPSERRHVTHNAPPPPAAAPPPRAARPGLWFPFISRTPSFPVLREAPWEFVNRSRPESVGSVESPYS